MKKFLIFILLVLAFSAAWGQGERVKTVEVPDSASMVVFDTTGNNVAGTDVQEAIEESNPTYNNHVWISPNGNNATGRLGDPHRAFADPWAAQQLIGSNNLSFIAYQGNYAYSGPYPSDNSQRISSSSGSFFAIGESDYISSGSTGATWPIFSDVTNISTRASDSIDYTIFAPQSSFTATNSGLTSPIGFWHYDSKVNITAKNLYGLGARGQGIWGACGIMNVNADSIIGTGDSGVLLGPPRNSTGIFLDTISGTRVWQIKANYIQASRNTDYGAIRYQNNESYFQDSLSVFEVIANTVVSDAATAFGIAPPQTQGLQPKKFKVLFDVEKLRSPAGLLLATSNSSTPTSKDTINELNLTFNVSDYVRQGAGGRGDILYFGGDDGNGRGDFNNSFISLNLGKIYDFEAFDFNSRATSFTNTIVDINCLECENNTTTPTPIFTFGNTNIGANSEIRISGNYTGLSNLIHINATATVSGKIILENVVFSGSAASAAITSDIPITIYVDGDLSFNSSLIDDDVTFEKIEYGYRNPTNTQYEDTQTILNSLFAAIPKHSATLYQSTLRQYTFPTLATVDTIIIDTLSNALMTDSITQDTGYIRNISSDTMRWQVSYNFFRDSDEDALTSFMDLTTAGTDSPEAIPGSEAYSEQAVANGTQHAGQTFTVDVPPGDAIRLCVYGSAPAAGVDISDLTISVQEIYRE